MKIQEINKSLYISLPAQICRAKGWKKGDVLKYRITDKGNIELF